MPRQFVSRAELTKILTDRMRELPNGKHCALAGVLRLPRPDKHGCNWMPGVVANVCRSALNKVVAKARLEFNLDEDQPGWPTISTASPKGGREVRMRDAPAFFVPAATPETAESVYADFAKGCGGKVPPPGNRIYSITWLHHDEEWTATVGEPLRGIRRGIVRSRGKKIERAEQLRDPAVVLAIFPDVVFKVVTNHLIDGKTSIRSAWANPILVGNINSVTYFFVSPKPAA